MIPKTINICGIPYKIAYGKNDYDQTDRFGQIIEEPEAEEGE